MTACPLFKHTNSRVRTPPRFPLPSTFKIISGLRRQSPSSVGKPFFKILTAFPLQTQEFEGKNASQISNLSLFKMINGLRRQSPSSAGKPCFKILTAFPFSNTRIRGSERLSDFHPPLPPFKIPNVLIGGALVSEYGRGTGHITRHFRAAPSCGDDGDPRTLSKLYSAQQAKAKRSLGFWTVRARGSLLSVLVVLIPVLAI